MSYLAPIDGTMNLHVAPVDAIDQVRVLTRRRGRGLAPTTISGGPGLAWTRDGGHIVYLVDERGDENWSLYAVDVQSGQEHGLVISSSAQVRILALSDDDPNSLLVSMNDRNPRWHDAYRIDVATGERQLVEENEQFVAYVADNALALRIGLALSPSFGFEIYTSSGDGEWRLLETLPPGERPGRALGFDAQNRQLFVLATGGRRDKAAVEALDLETGTRTLIAEDPRADVSGVLIDPIARDVQAFETLYVEREWEILDEDIRPHMEFLEGAGRGDLAIVGRSSDDGRWLVSHTADDAPVRYSLYERRTQELRPLFVGTPQLEGLPLTRMHPMVISSRDGLTLVSYIAYPRWLDPDGDGRPSEPPPTVMIVHGGPAERVAMTFSPLLQWLTNRGYAVLLPNFRGSSGFGQAFEEAQAGEWGGKMHDDLIDHVEHGVSAQLIDPDRIAILGGSYGGYATLVGMTFTPEVFACGVSVVGPSNLETFATSIPAHWSLDVLARHLGDPRTPKGRELLRSRSPLHFVDNVMRPLLIVQGANDARVPQAESDQFVDAMVEKGLPVTYLLFPDEGHIIARAENISAFQAVTEVFLAGCLGGRTEPLGSKLAGSSLEVPVGAEHIPGLEAAVAALEMAR